MGDVKALISDPEFQQLDLATQRKALSQADPTFGGLSDTELKSFMSSATPQKAGFMERLADNMLGAVAPFESPGSFGHAVLGTLSSLGRMASPIQPDLNSFHPDPQLQQSMQDTPGAQAADVLTGVGLAVAPELGKGVLKVGKAAGGALRDTAEATMSKPAQAGIMHYPSNLLRRLGSEFLPQPESFTGVGGGPSTGVPKSFVHGLESPNPTSMAPPPVNYKPQATQQVAPPPPIKFRTADSFEPVAAPPVKFKQTVEPATKSVAAPPVKYRAADEPSTRVVPAPPVKFNPIESPSPVQPPAVKFKPQSTETPKSYPAPPVRFKPVEEMELAGGTPESKSLPPADPTELNRMLHAHIQGMELPGSPAGQRSPGTLTQLGKDLFEKPAWSDVTLDERRKLMNYLIKNPGKLPKAGEL